MKYKQFFGAAVLLFVAVGAARAQSTDLSSSGVLLDRVAAIVRPVLDLMQTMPAFVYLIPAAMFFGLGAVPGTIATVTAVFYVSGNPAVDVT